MLQSFRNTTHAPSSIVAACAPAHVLRATRAVRLLCGFAAIAACTFNHAALVNIEAAGADDFVMAPTWHAVDFNLFASAAGLLPAAELLPPATHVDLADLGIGPGEAHAAPYDFEISDALTAAGLIDEFEFAEDDIDGGSGNAIYFAFNLIADPDNAPVGSTPDGDQAMLPLELFGLDVMAIISRTSQSGGMETLGEFLIVLDAPDPALFPDFTLAGLSHLPFFFAIDPAVLVAGQTSAGDYQLRFVLRDSGGNGYNLTTDFSVLPVSAPGSAAFLTMGLAMWLGMRTAGLPLLRRLRRWPSDKPRNALL